jgi:hypothetical protein
VRINSDASSIESGVPVSSQAKPRPQPLDLQLSGAQIGIDGIGDL